MLITISDVSVTKHSKGYNVAEVKFVRDGKEESRKILDFAAKKAFDIVSSFKSFPVDVNVVLEKNAKSGYWDWKDVEVAKEGNVSMTGKTGRVVGSNYETPEERARRQVYIIRQSSISSAISLLALAGELSTVSKTVKDVLEIAKEFEQYVMDVSEPKTDGVPF